MQQEDKLVTSLPGTWPNTTGLKSKPPPTMERSDVKISEESGRKEKRKEVVTGPVS